MVQKWVVGLREKTGRSLDDWMNFIQTAGPPDEKARRAWLKEKHGLGTNSAWWLAERSVGKGVWDDTPEDYLKTAERNVEAMFAKKEALRPLYAELLKFALSLGADVKACPCQTIVPLYRRHVFAQLKPTTRTRLDVHLALRDTPAPPRLINTGGFAKKDRLTHRIPISHPSDIDDEVRHWLRFAYEFNP
jgi:hypothetical protein